jgi:hypothetical protein
MSPREEFLALAALYASEVRPEIWQAVEARTAPTDRRLVAWMTDDEATKLELEIRRLPTGDVCVAFADPGINAFLADSEENLAAMVGEYLHRSGFLRFAQEIEIQDAEAPRAHPLDTEPIWTHEEVHT